MISDQAFVDYQKSPKGQRALLQLHAGCEDFEHVLAVASRIFQAGFEAGAYHQRTWNSPPEPPRSLHIEGFTVPQEVEAYLRMDRVLPEETIRAITELVRVSYAAFPRPIWPANQSKLEAT